MIIILSELSFRKTKMDDAASDFRFRATPMMNLRTSLDRDFANASRKAEQELISFDSVSGFAKRERVVYKRTAWPYPKSVLCFSTNSRLFIR